MSMVAPREMGGVFEGESFVLTSNEKFVKACNFKDLREFGYDVSGTWLDRVESTQ